MPSYDQNMAHKNKTNWSAYKARNPHNSSSSSQLRGRHQTPSQIFSLKEAEERLHDIFFNHEVKTITPRQISQMARFYRLLMMAQAHNNFTRLLKFRDIAIKHFVDSILVTYQTPLQFPLLDVGTGPGFPGIVLKILYPQERILLAEGVQKRVEFLKQVRDELQLEQLEIFGRNITPEFEYPVPAVITRAVEDMSNTLNNVSRCLQINGKVYFMKGPNIEPELALVKNAPVSQYYQLVTDKRYQIPKTSHQRSLIIYQKVASPQL